MILADEAQEMSPLVLNELRLLASAGNYRIFISMAGELLMSAAQREITTLDEKLYLQVFARPDAPATRRAARN